MPYVWVPDPIPDPLPPYAEGEASEGIMPVFLPVCHCGHGRQWHGPSLGQCGKKAWERQNGDMCYCPSYAPNWAKDAPVLDDAP